MIDFPPDTYMHVVQHDIFLSKVRYLLITHSHQDHFYPLDLAMRKPIFSHFIDKKYLKIFGNSKVVEGIKFYNLESEDTKIIAQVLRPFQTIEEEGYSITALLADHQRGEECLIYLISKSVARPNGGQPSHLPLADEEGKTLLWGTDTGFFPERTWEALSKAKLDLVVLDTTSGPHSSPSYHMGIPEVVRTKERMLKEGIADSHTIFVATHFSHNGGLLHEELEKVLSPHGIYTAWDGFTLEI